MSGIQTHTSAPINSNSENAPGNSSSDGSDVLSSQQSLGNTPATRYEPPKSANNASNVAEIPSKTVAPPPSAQYPAPPQPGQTPIASMQTPYSVPPMPIPQQQAAAGNIPSLSAGTAFSGQTSTPPVQQDLSHPPGYQQQTTSFQDRPVIEEQSSNTLFGTSVTRPVGSLLDTGVKNDSLTDQSPIWDTAKSWAKAAGDKLSTTEAQVWKMVNGDK